MKEIDFFKSELDSLNLSFKHSILKNDKAVDELFNVAIEATRKPNLRFYFNQMKPEFNQRSVGEYEKEINHISSLFMENFEKVDSEFHFYDYLKTPIFQRLYEIDKLINELESDKIIDSNHFDKESRFSLIANLINGLPKNTKECVLEWIRDYSVFDALEGILGEMSNQKEIRISLIDYLKKNTKNSDNPYKGISKDLQKYVEGLTDEIFYHIVKHKELPQNAIPLKWRGIPTDGIRLMKWLEMTPAPFKKCFGANIHGSNGNGINWEKGIKLILNKYLKE